MSKTNYSFDSKGLMMLRRSTIFTSAIIIFVSSFLCGSAPQPSAPKTSWLQSMRKDNPLFVEGIVGGGAAGFAASHMLKVNPLLPSTLGAIGGVLWLNRRWKAQEYACRGRIGDEEYRRGHVAGHAFGKAIGRAEGNLEGFATGKEEGLKEGRKEGYDKAIVNFSDYLQLRLKGCCQLTNQLREHLGYWGEQENVKNAWANLIDPLTPLSEQQKMQAAGTIRIRLNAFVKENQAARARELEGFL